MTKVLKKNKSVSESTYVESLITQETEHQTDIMSTFFWLENGIDILHRRITLTNDIDEQSTIHVVRALLSMVQDEQSEPIDIFISSYGGSVYDGFALYDIIEHVQNTFGITIRTHAIGKIMSMAFLIYLAGNERYSLPRTAFMHHEISDISEGKTSDIEESLVELHRLRNLVHDILEQRTKKNKAWWKKQEKHLDLYFDVCQARKLGIVTH